MAKTKATRPQIIRETKQIALKTDGPLTRNFLRAKSIYSDAQRAQYFPTHESLLAACGLIIEPATVQPVTPAERLALEQTKLENKKNDSKTLLAEAVKRISVLEREKDAILDLKDRTPQITDIKPQKPSGTSESVAVIVASDWHSEEEVLSGQVGGLNAHNLEIGARRAENFWKGSLRMVDIFRRDTSINTIVVGLLGDFLTNSIHEDGAESNLLPPSDAIYRVQNMLLSGLRFLLDNTTAELVVVCHSGNHGRTTKEQRIATETGNSLEQYMYFNIRDLMANEPRVRFQIADGYHSYVRLFDGKYVMRFHHGHGMNFGGGVGGITIPVNKAIAQWNKGVRADLDVFGHFHTKMDANNFVSNGSLIGYNAYALRIKADYEAPTQSFFLVNKRWNAKSCYTPIFVQD